jgi:branched-chain amino acid transport system permease protein
MSEVRVQHSNWSSRIGTTIVVIAFMALAAAPWWAERANLRLLAEIYAYVALASLWNLLAGYAGLVSVGQQAYVGLGAYILFGLAMLAGVHPLAAIPLAGIAAAIIAVPVAALIFRLRGHYFAIGTWVVAEVFRLLAAQTSALDGGSGTSLPAAVVISIAESRQMREFVIYWIALAQVAVILFAIAWLLRSRYGLALTAIRDNELGARSNGVDVARIKYAVYVAVAFGTAMVGALIFLQKIRISPDTAFSVNDWAAFVIFITVIGGIGRIEGPIIGTVIFFLLADLGRSWRDLSSDPRRRRHCGHAVGAQGTVGPDRRPLRLAGVPAAAAADAQAARLEITFKRAGICTRTGEHIF